jgi:hypothetical protein
VLARHCADVERDPATVKVTHLSTALGGRDQEEVEQMVATLRPSGTSPEAYRTWANAATVDDHIGRFRELAEAGVQHAIVSLPDLDMTEPVERFGAVIAAFN